MADFDVISLSSDSSRPSSPFINVSDVFNESGTFNKTPFINCDDSTELGIYTAKIGRSSPSKNRLVHTLSESDNSDTEPEASCTSNGEFSSTEIKRLLDKYNLQESCNSAAVEIETLESCSDKIQNDVTSPMKYLNSRKKTNHGTKMTKEQKEEDKQHKKREKEQKKAAKELQNYLKPGNCLKYMTVMLDSSLVMCPYGGMSVAAVQNSESKCHISTHIVPHTILWKRELPGQTQKEENFVVVVWDWQIIIPAIKNHELCSKIQEIQHQYLGKSIYLVFYGLNAYFSYLKSKRRNQSGEMSKRKKRENSGNEFPYVTRKEIEEELIELQIMTNCNHRLVESPEDLSQLIVQITKAIAETPFKVDKQRRELENLEWFAVGDSRDCVTVDKAGNGLLRLWQQQLCQFNLAGHDVAQAIASVYPSPHALVSAYDKCSSKKEAEDLIKDIPVRRCQGPLSSSRRIGPELSKKVFTFFCSTEGETPLSQEQ